MILKEQLIQILLGFDIPALGGAIYPGEARHLADEITSTFHCEHCRYWQQIEQNVIRVSHCVNSQSPTFTDLVPADFFCARFTPVKK